MQQQYSKSCALPVLQEKITLKLLDQVLIPSISGRTSQSPNNCKLKFSFYGSTWCMNLSFTCVKKVSIIRSKQCVFIQRWAFCVKRIWKLSPGTTYQKINRQSESNCYMNNERTLKIYHSLRRQIYIISYLLGCKPMLDYF